MYNYEEIKSDEETFVRIYTKESGFNIYDFDFFKRRGRENGCDAIGIYYCKIERKIFMLLGEVK